MNRFANIVQKIGGVGIAIGSVFLIAISLLIVANIIVRAFGPTIQGTYELVELLVIVPVVFGLTYTALKQRHIVIEFVVSRLPERLRLVAEVFTNTISLGFWAIVVWASANLILDRGLAEESQVLGIAYLPFRFVWVLGLVLLCLVFFVDLSRALSKVFKK